MLQHTNVSRRPCFSWCHVLYPAVLCHTPLDVLNWCPSPMSVLYLTELDDLCYCSVTEVGHSLTPVSSVPPQRLSHTGVPACRSAAPAREGGRAGWGGVINFFLFYVSDIFTPTWIKHQLVNFCWTYANKWIWSFPLICHHSAKVGLVSNNLLSVKGPLGWIDMLITDSHPGAGLELFYVSVTFLCI